MPKNHGKKKKRIKGFPRCVNVINSENVWENYGKFRKWLGIISNK
jgi:hypothetical protein